MSPARRALIVAWTCWAALLTPTLAALALAGALRATGLDRALAPAGWVVAAPALYFAWLVAFLALSAAEVRLRFGRLEKPAYGTLAYGHNSYLTFIITLCYAKAYLIRSLPMTSVLLGIPAFRNLVLRAYAPRAKVGDDILLAGFVYDPDLTEIAERVVIGGGAVLCAHAMSAGRDGEPAYLCAPIRIAVGSVVGGSARINMGVTIGPGAVIEAGSNVAPFTTVGPGEVWAGNPAVLVRRRDTAAPAPSPTPPSPRADAAPPDAPREAARRLVAAAIGRPAAEPDDWDSVEQLAIAAALESAHGRRVPREHIFALRTLEDVARYLAAPGPPAPPIDDALPDDPELIPALDHERATRLLAERGFAPATTTPPFRVAIAASFTAEPLAPTLRLWAGAFGVAAEVEFAPFGQVQQALRDPDGPFLARPGDLNVVLLRPEDLPQTPESLEHEMNSLLDAIARLRAERPGVALAVGTLPPPVAPAPLGRVALDRARAEWRARLAALDGVEAFDLAAIVESLGLAVAADPGLDAIARAPYSPAAFREVGIGLARLVRRRRRPRAKVLALDCDGVLWGGVVAEDGPDGIRLGPDGPGRAFQAFQRAVLDLKRRGVLLALVSRNEEADVLRVLDEHPGCLLRRDDLAGWRVGWEPKPALLAELADALGLAPDAFVFLDDDPAQRLRMAAERPEVHVLPLPDDPARFADALDRLWIFDDGPATDEDARRTEMVLQERRRRAHLGDAPALASYLEQLGLVVTIRDAEPRDLARAAQLTQKTNQFHLALRRRTVEDLRGLGPAHRVLVASARDRFGDYGTIGLAILRPGAGPGPGLAELDTFLLSCRALGRGIEQAFLSAVFDLAAASGARRLRAPYVEGPRNRPALDFFAGLGFAADPDGPAFEADLARAPARPGHLALETPLALAP
jgi:FkbH-like protein